MEVERKPPLTEGFRAVVVEGEFVSNDEGRYDVRVPKVIVDGARRWVGIEYDHPQYLPSRNSLWPLRLPDDPQEAGPPPHQAGARHPCYGARCPSDGSPAPDVPLMFGSNRDGFGDSNGGFPHGFWTRTDQQGRYQFNTRNTWPQRVHWFPDQYENNSRALTKDFGEQETIRLKPGLTLAGSVLDQHGQPLAGIVIQATAGTRVPHLFATSDDKGVFRFALLPPGQYSLMAVRSYHDNASGDSLTADLPMPIPGINYQLDAATASAQPRALIQALPLVRIPVEVVDGAGKPLSDAVSIGDAGNFMNAVLARPLADSPGKI